MMDYGKCAVDCEWKNKKNAHWMEYGFRDAERGFLTSHLGQTSRRVEDSIEVAVDLGGAPLCES